MRWRVAVPLTPTAGYRKLRWKPNCARASSTRSAAMRRSALFASASVIRASSSFDSNTLPQGRSARLSVALAGARQPAGTATSGRTGSGVAQADVDDRRRNRKRCKPGAHSAPPWPAVGDAAAALPPLAPAVVAAVAGPLAAAGVAPLRPRVR